MLCPFFITRNTTKVQLALFYSVFGTRVDCPLTEVLLHLRGFGAFVYVPRKTFKLFFNFNLHLYEYRRF